MSEVDTALQHKLAAMFMANKDDVSVPKIYIDMVEDYAAACVLDELLFWTLPKKNGRTSLRVFRNGSLWLAVRRSDWWDRKRLTERQADRAIDKLINLDLLEKDIFLFDGKPTVHLRMKMQNFASLYGKAISEIAEQEKDENLAKDLSDLYAMMGIPFNQTVNSNLPNGEMLNLPNGEIINSPVQPENTSIGSYEPQNIEQAIFAGKPVTEKMLDGYEQKHAQMIDSANLLDMGCIGGGALALAFMEARSIVIPESKIKGQRKVARELIKQGVTPDHVREAVKKLLEENMTVTDLFSVEKTAVSLANPPQEQGYNPQGLEIKI